MTSGKTRIQDFLARLPLFNELSAHELDNLASGTTEVQVARGEMVFHRGESCVGLHTVVYGQIKLMFVSPAGSEKVVRLIGPGDSFGEALMRSEEHTSELQSLLRISYAVLCLKKKTETKEH